MPRSTTIRYTYEDYLSIPVDTPGRHEIVDGELFMTAAPSHRHQKVVVNLVRILADLADQHGLGDVVASPITVHLHDELVVQPDIAFTASDRLAIIDPEGDIHGPPDLVVEVLSPSSRDYDRNLKRKHYMENGVAELWIVDADQRTVEVWRAGADEAEVVQGVLSWTVADGSLPIDLDLVFRD